MSRRLAFVLAVVAAVVWLPTSPARADVPAAPLTPAVTLDVFAATGTCAGVKTIFGLNQTDHSQLVTYTLYGRLSSTVNGTFTIKCKISDSTWTTSNGLPLRYAYTYGLRTTNLTHTNPFRICIYIKGVFSNWPLSNTPSVYEDSKCESG